MSKLMDEYICSNCNSWDDDLQNDTCAYCEATNE